MIMMNINSSTQRARAGKVPALCTYLRKVILLAAQTIILFSLSAPVSAELLDDIRLVKENDGGVIASVNFSVPIQYVRHFPKGKSSSVSIYFNVLGSVPREQWMNYEAFRSPPSEIVTRFTVTTRDPRTGPKLIVDFDRPAEFTVTQGRDGQSILIHIKADRPQRQTEPEVNKPAVVVPAPVVMAPAPVSPAAVLPPKEAPPAKPVVAAAPPVEPVAPPPVPAPVPASTPPVAVKAVPPQQIHVPAPGTPLGGKDGLPPFPKIDPYAVPAAGTTFAEPVTPEERLKRSNDQAAPLMIAGRDAMLSGQLFSAMEFFNKVLNLPPNKYSSDAQLWMGIARERSGQQLKARAEYELYLKLYPDGAQKDWVAARLTRLAPAPAPKAAAARPDPVRPPATEFKYTQYGSVSAYYYHGASQTDTITTAGTIQTPVTLSATDQSSLISNANLTARAFNNQYDNRLVFQGLFSANFLPGKDNTNRINSAYYEFRSRVDNYSTRIGRQSALGGGVLGRFDGISGGYGFLPNWRINAAAGRLSDYTLDSKPTFYSGALDFGLNDPLGGSVYYINQKANGMIDRKATGGYLRYFEQGMTGMAIMDYDLQFKETNILTLQGTLNQDNGMDFNFLLDRRRSPSWSLRNAVTGTTSTIDILLQNGWTLDDILALAKQRTAISNIAQVGMTQRLNEKWQVGTDLSLSNTSGLPESGTMLPDGTIGLEGYVPATASTGTAWSLSGRASGTNVFTTNDLSSGSLTLAKSSTITGITALLNSRVFMQELWTLDSTLRLYWQKDDLGGKQYIISPVFRASYRWRSDVTLEGDFGLDWINTDTTGIQSSKTTREYFSFGARWDY